MALLLTCGRVTQELRAMLDRARYDADHDGLTGAISRTSFRERLDRIADRALDEGPAALLLVDLDNFGHVNKTAGHAAGDALLRQWGRRWTERLSRDELPPVRLAVRDGELSGVCLVATPSRDEDTGDQFAERVGVAVPRPA